MGGRQPRQHAAKRAVTGHGAQPVQPAERVVRRLVSGFFTLSRLNCPGMAFESLKSCGTHPQLSISYAAASPAVIGLLSVTLATAGRIQLGMILHRRLQGLRDVGQ